MIFVAEYRQLAQEYRKLLHKLTRPKDKEALKGLSVPILFLTITCSPALSASTSLRCADGHQISASTGTNGGSCTTDVVKGVKSVHCNDGGNVGNASCDGTATSTGAGTSSARKKAQGGTSPPKSGTGTATSTGTNKSGGTTTKNPIGGVSPPTTAGANKGPSGGGTTTLEKSSGKH